MRALADDEHKVLVERRTALERQLLMHLVPKDPDDDANLFLEVRAGTGGDEAAIFAGDLFRMYSRYAERQGWRVEILSANPGEHGGYREVISRVAGKGAYSKLKFESGVHRVQRVPGHRGARPHPHLDVHGGRVPGARGNRRDRDQQGGSQGRHLSRVGRRRPARQQDRLGDPHHAFADGHRRRMPGRALAAQEPRARDVVAASAHARRGRDASARPRRPRSAAASSARAIAPSASAPTTSRKAALTDHRINLTLYKVEDIVNGDLDDVIGPLANEYQADLLGALGLEG